MKSAKSTGTPADPSAPALITLRRQLRQHLHPTLARLRAVHAAVSTSALALQHQNADADADADVALLLARCAGEPLLGEIERLEALLLAFEGRAAPPQEATPAPMTLDAARRGSREARGGLNG